MHGTTSTATARDASASGHARHAGTAHGAVTPLVRSDPRARLAGAALRIPPFAARQEGSPVDQWPLQSFLELGALPGAVPCARLHARHVLWEWGLASLPTAPNSWSRRWSRTRCRHPARWPRPPSGCGWPLTGRRSWSWPGMPARCHRYGRNPARTPRTAGACCWSRPSASSGAGTSPASTAPYPPQVSTERSSGPWCG